MPSPAITIHGILQDLFGAPLFDGVLVFQLCGYGSAIPRVAGTSIIAKTAPDNIETASDGSFSKTLYGNDLIVPAGTFYTVQIQDDNGNVVQTNAYQFTGTSNLDLSTVAPYDPANPIPTPPVPTVLSGDVIVPFSATPIFNCSLIPIIGLVTFEMILTGNVTSSSIISQAPGMLVTFLLKQDGTGGRTFVWPSNVHNAAAVPSTANQMLCQTFSVRSDSTLWPISQGTYN